MSTGLVQAIYGRLAGLDDLTAYPLALAARGVLAANLDGDPDEPGRPAVYFANKNTSPNGLRCITFRPSGGVPDERIQEGAGVETAYFDMEIWDTGTSGTAITNIAGAVERLIDMRRAAPTLMVPDGITVFYATFFAPVSVMPDTKRNAWFGLMRFKVVEGRA